MGPRFAQITAPITSNVCWQRAMISLGFAVDAKISILAFNRPEWVIADLAAMMAGGVPADLSNLLSDEVAYIISHSDHTLSSLKILISGTKSMKRLSVSRIALGGLDEGVSLGAQEVPLLPARP